MTKQDRPTLKSFFRSGSLPTAKEFGDLIDSTVNQVDDGFAKTDTDGLRLNSVGSSLKVLSLYQGLGTPKPSWIIEHGEKDGVLNFRPDEGQDVLKIDEDAKSSGKTENTFPPNMTMTRDGMVGINQEEPEWRFDVGGVARMQGRIGVATPKYETVPADRGWHPITEAMTGCQILEVVAGTGGEPGKGRYSIMRAIAMNAYHPRNRFLNWFFRRRSIKTQTAMYGSYADRICLRWVADKEKEHHYILELKTNAEFEGKLVRYYITKLWFDSAMVGAHGKKDDRDENLL